MRSDVGGPRQRACGCQRQPPKDPPSMNELAHAYETVNLHRRGGAATIELNRPETMNAWNQQFGDRPAGRRRARWPTTTTVRAVCITGAGRGFSSGADLKEMGTNDDRTPEGHPDVRTTLTERYHPIITGIRRDAQAGGGGGQRAGGGHRLLAGALAAT